MKQRPKGMIYFALSVMIIIFFTLFYWSFVLQEERLRAIEENLRAIKQDLQIQKAIASKPSQVKVALPNVQSVYPNLLVEDPYLQTTLPTLLGPHFVPKGVLRMAVIGKPDLLHPFSQWAQVSEWTSYCQAAAAQAKVGFYEILAQDFATRIEERPADREDRTSFWIYLRNDLFWQPLEPDHFPPSTTLASHFLEKHQVTAHDFAFYWQALSNPHVDVAQAVALRFLLRDIEQVQVVDDRTFVVTVRCSKQQDEKGQAVFKPPYAAHFYVAQLRPLPCFVYQYGLDGQKICPDDALPDFYAQSSLWAQHFVSHFASRVIVSCGPWIFDGMTDEQIRFRRNPDYFSQVHALYEAMEVYFLETQDAIWRDFLAQKIDLCLVSPQNHIELERYLVSKPYEEQKKRGQEIEQASFLQRQFSYIAWNQNKTFFQNKKVRQALTVAIDRERLVRQNLSGQAMEVTGPFFRDSLDYDQQIEAYPYDPDRAKRLLAEEGWFDSNGDGIIDKVIDGERIDFRFSLTYFVKDQSAKSICEMVALFMKQVGIDCVLNGLDIADLSASFDNKGFDALFLAWALSSPPEDPRQLWHSEGAEEKSSSNMIGFRNEEVDRAIELLQFEADAIARRQLYWKLHQIFHDEQPYTFLFTNKATLLWWNWIDNIFIPKKRQDLIPGAVVEQPVILYSWKR